MRTSKLTGGIILGILLLSLLSCADKQKKNVSEDRLIVDSLLVSRIDSIYTYPLKMREVFRKAQKHLTDSIAYYKLELFTGFSFYVDGHQDSTRAIHQKILDFCQRTPGSKALEAAYWNHHATILQLEGRQDSALTSLHHAYDALYHSDDHRELTSVCINIADMYSITGQVPEAAAYYRKALFIADSLHTYRENFAVYIGLAQTYSNLYNFTLADHYFQLAENSFDNALAQEKVLFYNFKGNSLY